MNDLGVTDFDNEVLVLIVEMLKRQLPINELLFRLHMG